ncbi:MAG: SAP domain-containing protein [Promethearchaeota archaeon]
MIKTKSIKYLLPNEKLQTLIHICQIFGLRGYTKLRKEGIINLISENLKNPQFKESIRFLIPDNGTVALIFKSFIDNNGEITYQELRNDVIQKRSRSTFRENYRALMAKYIIFEDEKSEDDIHYLPEEYISIAKEIIEKRIKEELEPEIEEIEEIKEEKTITTIDQLLYSKRYTSISSLQQELMARNLKISGNKSQLIERLIYESGEDIKDILGFLFGKVELKEIAREFGLKVSGTKDDLIENILEKLPPAYPERMIVKEKKIKIEGKELKEKIEILGSGVVKEKAPIENEVIKQTQSKLTEKKEKTIDIIFNALNDINLDYKNISDIKTLAGQIFSNINNVRLYIPSLRESKPYRDTKEQVITIKNQEEVVTVFPWYFDRGKGLKGQKDKISGNIMRYSDRFSEDLICYIYDPAAKLTEEDLRMFRKFARVIHKIEREFKD